MKKSPKLVVISALALLAVSATLVIGSSSAQGSQTNAYHADGTAHSGQWTHSGGTTHTGQWTHTDGAAHSGKWNHTNP